MADRYRVPKGLLKKASSQLGFQVFEKQEELQRALERMFAALGDRPVDFEQLLDGVASRTFGSIVLMTPVDTGRARSGWRLGKVKRTDGGTTWRIVNSVPYIVYLELGSSGKAPKGMVRISLDKMRRDIDTGTKRILRSK